MNIWRLNIKPDSDPGVAPRRFCLDRGLLGGGWAVGAPSGVGAEEYRRKGRDKYGDRSWKSFIRAIQTRMKEGDLCWTRDRGGIYYLGRVTGPWRYAAEPENLRADVVNVRPCDWVEVGEADAVPGKVANSLRGRTLQRVGGKTIEAYSKHAYSKRRPGRAYELDGVDADLFRLLGPDGCEDVVALYLQERGYRLIPSTCKKNTACYEYVLRREDGRKAFAQVKQGHTDLDAGDYEHLGGEVFLFSTHGECHAGGEDGVHVLEREELESFIRSRVEAMPEKIQNWVEISQALGRPSRRGA